MATPRKEGPRARATAIDPKSASDLRDAIRIYGLEVVAKDSGFSPGAICGMAAEVGCHDSSKKLIKIYLENLKDENDTISKGK